MTDLREDIISSSLWRLQNSYELDSITRKVLKSIAEEKLIP